MEGYSDGFGRKRCRVVGRDRKRDKVLLRTGIENVVLDEAGVERCLQLSVHDFAWMLSNNTVEQFIKGLQLD